MNITCWYLKIYARLLSSFVSSLNQFYVYTTSDKASQWKWLDLKVWMWLPLPTLHYSSKFISCNQSYTIWHLSIDFQVLAKVTLCSHLMGARIKVARNFWEMQTWKHKSLRSVNVLLGTHAYLASTFSKPPCRTCKKNVHTLILSYLELECACARLLHLKRKTYFSITFDLILRIWSYFCHWKVLLDIYNDVSIVFW